MKEELKKILGDELSNKVELIEKFFDLVEKEEIALTEEQILRINSNINDLLDYKISQVAESSKELLANTKKEIEQVKTNYETLKNLSYDFTQNKLKTEDLKKNVDLLLKTIDSNELLKKIELVRRLQSFDTNKMQEMYETSQDDLKKASSKNTKSSFIMFISCLVLVGSVFYTTHTLKDVNVIKEEISKKQEIVNNLDEIIIKLNKEKQNLKNELTITYLKFFDSNCFYRSDLENDILKMKMQGYKAIQSKDKKLYLVKEEDQKEIGYCK